MLIICMRAIVGSYKKFGIHCSFHFLSGYVNKLYYESQGTRWNQKSIHKFNLYSLWSFFDFLSDVDIVNGLEYR